MIRDAIGERSRFYWHVARRGWRGVRRRMAASSLSRWRDAPPRDDRLVLAPQDLRTADPTRASEIYAGRFVFAGQLVEVGGRSPFAVEPPSVEWALALYGFGWLRHLRAAETALSRENARALVDEWITQQGSWHELSWRPEFLARRIISWVSHGGFVLSEADPAFYRRFVRSLGRQVRHLRRTLDTVPPGRPTLEAVMALAYAGVALDQQANLGRYALKRLADELNRQILPDGGHVSRHPGVPVDLLIDLLPLRQALTTLKLPVPAELAAAIDRMMPTLRFLRLGDGALARFNGMGPTRIDLIATVLAYSENRGEPLRDAPASGYVRRVAGPSVLIADVGPPPTAGLSVAAHAGTLAFEWSVGDRLVVVNCGLPEGGRAAWREDTRATAAHSTAVLADTSSSRFRQPWGQSRNAPSLIMAGPRRVTLAADVPFGFEASHDGYARPFGLIHRRSLALAPDGLRLDGVDRFEPDGLRARAPETVPFALRFHLHPAVRAAPLGDGRTALLTLAPGEIWLFTTLDHPVTIADSVFLAGSGGPLRTRQLVVSGGMARGASIAWSFERVAPGT
jgi:uncharacterized heparinase superfamily protein